MIFLKKSHFILILLFAAIFYNSYRIEIRKDGMFMDEVYSFVISNSNDIPYMDFFNAIKEGRFLDYANELKKLDIDMNKEILLKSMSIDGKEWSLFNTYLNKTVGDEHPPLYYFILHTVCYITQSSNFNLIGFSINIFFMLLSCLFVYKIVKDIKRNETIAILAVACFGFSYGFICIITLCRMYSMLACEFIALLYLYLKISHKNWDINKKDIACVCSLELILMLTHYFALFLILPFFFIALKYIKNGNKSRYVKTNFITAAIYLLIWPQSLFYVIIRSGFRMYLGFYAFYRYYYYIGTSLKWIFPLNWVTLFVLLGLLLFISYYLFRNKASINRLIKTKIITPTNILLVVPVLVAFLCITAISPWIHQRYSFPTFPLLFVAFYLLFISCLQKIFKQKGVFIIMATYLIGILYFTSKEKSDFLYEYTEEKKNYEQQYSKYPAVMLFNEFGCYFLEIMANYTHPNYRLVVGDFNDIKHSNIHPLDSSYVLYVLNNDSVNISKAIQEGISIDYNMDYYTMFLINGPKTHIK